MDADDDQNEKDVVPTIALAISAADAYEDSDDEFPTPDTHRPSPIKETTAKTTKATFQPGV